MQTTSKIVDALVVLRDAGLSLDEVMRIAKRIGTRRTVDNSKK